MKTETVLNGLSYIIVVNTNLFALQQIMANICNGRRKNAIPNVSLTVDENVVNFLGAVHK